MIKNDEANYIINKAKTILGEAIEILEQEGEEKEADKLFELVIKIEILQNC